MNQKTIVIINPKSGSADDNFRDDIEAALQKVGIEYEVRETTPDVGGDKLAEAALQEGAGHLIACGGDGTIMAVVNGMARTLSTQRAEKTELGQRESEHHPVLSIIPGGTANLLATALDIPREIAGAVDVLKNGRDRDIDLGRCGQYFFALGIGIGLTERLVSQASAEAKEKLGKAAYALAMLKELGAKPSRFVIKRDDRIPHRRRGVAIVVANAGEIGGGMKFAPNAKMDDGLLDICVLHRFYLRDVLRLALRSILRNMPQDRAVSFSQAKKIEILSDPPLDVQIDGEVIDDLHTPLVIEVVEAALRVRVPIEKEQEMAAERAELGENPVPDNSDDNGK